MSRIEELPDDYEEHSSSASSLPSLKPTTATSAAPAPSQPSAPNGAPPPEPPPAATAPALPPALAEARTQSIDELAASLKRTPFFMTSLDDADDGLPNPELDAMRALLYEGTRGEIASNFKETGNEAARAKQWRDGKEAYTKGLAALGRARTEEEEGQLSKGKQREQEDTKEKEIKEALLVNRALCHLELQNYRSCTHDCLAALSLSPSNIKAHFRLARTLLALQKLPEALSASASGLALAPTNAPLLALRADIESADASAARAAAAKQAALDRRTLELATLHRALAARKIGVRWTKARPDLPEGAELKLVPDAASLASSLVFPVVLLYPLHAQSDVVAAFGEEQTLAGHLAYLLPPPWDARAEYTARGTEAYLETREGGLVKWGKEVELLRVVSGGKVEVVDGIVRVNLVPRARREEWIGEVRRRKGGKEGRKAEGG